MDIAAVTSNKINQQCNTKNNQKPKRPAEPHKSVPVNNRNGVIISRQIMVKSIMNIFYIKAVKFKN